MIWRLLVALAAGMLLPLAFAPFNLYGLAFISPAILYYLWLDAKPRQAFWLGWAYGGGIFGVGTSWVYISINTYGGTPFWLSWLATLLLVVALGLFYATLGYCAKRIYPRASAPVQCLCIFPGLWVLFEMIREFFLTGFPWLYLGYTQLSTPLVGLAPLFGVYGISLICAWIAGALVLLATHQTRSIKSLAMLLIILPFAVGWPMMGKHWTKPFGKPIKVSLVQGNVRQTLKWNPEHLRAILNRYAQLTQPLWSSSQLIIWPEAAVPTLPKNIPQYIEGLSNAAKQADTYLIYGAPVIDQGKFYNALKLVGPSTGRYYKYHLVPFGEYQPLTWLFGWFFRYFDIPMSDFSHGKLRQPGLQAGELKIAPYICYEIAFPDEVLETIDNKNLIVTLSDDSWFGRSIALSQHLQMAQMRALETGRPVAFSTNTGITALIDAQGHFIQVAPIDKRLVLTDYIQPTTGKTPLMWWKTYPILVLTLILLVIGFTG